MRKLIISCLAISLFNVSFSMAGNVALNKPAWATVDPYGTAPGAVDGLLAPPVGQPLYPYNWNSQVFGTAQNPVTLFVDLQDTYSVNQINLYADCRPIEGNFISYNLLSSIDQSSWTLINFGDLISTLRPWPERLDFEPVSMRYLQFQVTGGTLWAHLYEIEVYDVPEPLTLSLLGLGGLFLRRRK
jgi:hypothetical protein